METKPMSRRVFLQKGTRLFLAAVGSAGLLSGYTFFGEKYWVQTKHVSLDFARLPAAFTGFRMIHFSDVHLGRFYSYERLAELISHMNSLAPDMICFTGDLYDSINGIPSKECASLLADLQAPYGKFAVLGNHDYRSGLRRIIPLLEQSGFILLRNEGRFIEREGQRIRVAGVDDNLFGRPNLQQALAGDGNPYFTLLLSHEPDFADVAAQFPVDLQISGHSHGGQIRLPLLGALMTPEKGKKYVSGLYKIGASGLRVYTNRGIGMTYLPIRFLCRPELTVFQFKGK